MNADSRPFAMTVVKVLAIEAAVIVALWFANYYFSP
jgi:hypothetical protein